MPDGATTHLPHASCKLTLLTVGLFLINFRGLGEEYCIDFDDRIGIDWLLDHIE